MNKKIIIIFVALLLITSLVGASYAYWQFKNTQNDFNTMGSKCFEITLANETDAITIDKAIPITDEEGLKETGYTFTIKNTCNTSAVYDVNLEDVITEEKRLSGEYVKVSLNDGTPEVLTEKEEKTPTIEEADKAYLLTSGSLAPEEEKTYVLKLWMDEDTPAIDETMNATFLSKISVEAGYIKEEELNNNLTIEIESLTENINKESETFKIKGTSEKYNIIEYSEDNTHWTRINNSNKTFEIDKTYNQEGTYNFYIKDEVGNIKEAEINTTKIDQTKPTIEKEVIDNQESIDLKIILKDEKSGLSGYQITTSEEEPTEWISISGQETTIDYNIMDNNRYYIWVKDNLGNIEKEVYEVTTIDKTPPELEITNELIEWGTKDKIIINGTDDVIGLSEYSISKEEGVYDWQTIENNPLTYIKEIEITENGTYYVSVKDKYERITTKSIVIDKIDNVLPTIEGIEIDSEWSTTNHIKGTLKDNESGLLGYQVTKEDQEPIEYISISGSNYEINYEVGENGTYYIWIKDQNENVNKVSVEVTKVDKTAPTSSYSVGTNTLGSNGWYKALNLNIVLNDSQSGISSAKYCVTTSSTCTPTTNASISNNSFTVTLGSNASAQKVCTTVTDKTGNTSGVTCSGTYKVDTTNPSVTFGVNSSTSGSNGWYQALSIKATLSDSQSGISSAKYCVTTASTCTPGTNASISGNSFTVTLGSNASAQKVCTTVTDLSGRTSGVVCSGTYKVDTTNPTAKISASVSGSNITISASGSSDAHSGIATYQYSRNNSTWYSSTSSSYTFTGLADGTYTLYVKVVDKSGRVSSVVTTSATVKTIVSPYNLYNRGTWLDGNSSTFISGQSWYYYDNSSGIHFSVPESGRFWSAARTTNKVSLTGYKQITATGKCSRTGCGIGITTNPSLGANSGAVASYTSLDKYALKTGGTATLDMTLTVDVSSYTGAYYIYFFGTVAINKDGSANFYTITLTS